MWIKTAYHTALNMEFVKKFGVTKEANLAATKYLLTAVMDNDFQELIGEYASEEEAEQVFNALVEQL